MITNLSPPQHKDLLQLMIDTTEEGEGGGNRRLTDEEIVVQSITFLLAGYETTANTLAYTSYLLALNPEIPDTGETPCKPSPLLHSLSQSLLVTVSMCCVLVKSHMSSVPWRWGCIPLMCG